MTDRDAEEPVDDVVEQHRVADSMHGSPRGTRMQPAARTELHAWNVIARQMNGVGAGPPARAVC